MNLELEFSSANGSGVVAVRLHYQIEGGKDALRSRGHTSHRVAVGRGRHLYDRRVRTRAARHRRRALHRRSAFGPPHGCLTRGSGSFRRSVTRLDG